MSRTLQVEILGDSTSVERAFRKASSSASGFQRDVGKSSRGALAASGAFANLGRSVAFASTSFLGGAGLIAVMKSSIGAAEDLEVSQKRLETTMGNLGLGFNDHQKQIDATLASTEKLSAFTKQDLTDNLNRLLPATRNVSQGLKDMALAADIARARNIDLESATQIVLKAQEGQVGLLKRMGIAITPVKDAENALTDSHMKFTTETKAAAKAIDAHATSLKALDQLSKTYKGNAENDTTATQRFKDEANKLQVAIGGALLPEMNKLLEKLNPMIDRWTRSGTAARDVKTAVHDLDVVLQAAKGIVEAVDKVTGGFKQTLEGIAAIKLGLILKGWTAEMKAFAGASALGAAEAESAGLLGNLGKLKALGPIGVAVALSFVPQAKPSSDKNAFSNNPVAKGFAGLPIVGGVFSQANRLSDYLNGKLGITSSPSGSSSGSSLVGNPFGGLVPISGGSSAGIQSSLLEKVSAAVRAVGGTSVQITSGKRAPGPGNDVSNSNHITGNAIDGYVVFPNGQKVPIGQALKAVASQYGLRSGDVAGFDPKTKGGFDPIHVDDGANVNGGVPIGGNSIAALLAQGTTKVKKPKVLSGSSLLPASMRIALSKAAGTTSLTDDTAALKAAIGRLQGMKQTPEVAKELGSLQKQLHGVDTQIAANLKQREQSIKSSFSSLLSTDKSQISSAVSKLKSTLDTQFEKATSQYINDILGPKFFQGTDTSGMGLQTPLEKQLADMQAADTLKQLQDAITSATDDPSRQAAQRALDEYNLSIRATAERAQADHDYAVAVQKYQDDRTVLEDQLNQQLDKFGSGLSDGSSKLSDLQGIVAGFGLSISDPSSGIMFDFETLAEAVTALAGTLLTEAGKLAGVGDTKDSKAIGDAAARLGVTSAGGGSTAGLGAAAGYFLLNPIGMADGGQGRVTGPTLFYSGGNEDFAFSGEGRSFGAGGGGGLTLPDGDLVLAVNGEAIGRIARRELLLTGSRNVDILGGRG